MTAICETLATLNVDQRRHQVERVCAFLTRSSCEKLRFNCFGRVTLNSSNLCKWKDPVKGEKKERKSLTQFLACTMRSRWSDVKWVKSEWITVCYDKVERRRCRGKIGQGRGAACNGWWSQRCLFQLHELVPLLWTVCAAEIFYLHRLEYSFGPCVCVYSFGKEWGRTSMKLS